MRTLTNTTPPPVTARSTPACATGCIRKASRCAKSNWAQKLDTPPFYAYPVTGGITFSFGGVKVNDHAQVIGTDWDPIRGPVRVRRDGRRTVP